MHPFWQIRPLTELFKTQKFDQPPDVQLHLLQPTAQTWALRSDPTRGSPRNAQLALLARSQWWQGNVGAPCRMTLSGQMMSGVFLGLNLRACSTLLGL